MIWMATLSVLTGGPSLLSFDLAHAERPHEYEYRWDFETAHEWDELVASWRATTPTGSFLEVVVTIDGHSFTLGKWREGEAGIFRNSRNGQKHTVGDVSTDTFIAASPRKKGSLKLILAPDEAGRLPKVDRLWLSASQSVQEDGSGALPEIQPLDVPYRAQMSYPGGDVLCSPTSLSMVLAYWSKTLDRPVIDRDVPEVQKNVYDPVYKGCGNWSFNTSYAASLPGMTGYVSRLRGTSDLAAWLERGVPVVCSISYDLLKGKDKRGQGDGHLVVVVGMKGGKIILNDPGRNIVRVEAEVANFRRAWEASRRTVYLVYPKSWLPPEGPGPWASR